jgi:hypothetical protein
MWPLLSPGVDTEHMQCVLTSYLSGLRGPLSTVRVGLYTHLQSNGPVQVLVEGLSRINVPMSPITNKNKH